MNEAELNTLKAKERKIIKDVKSIKNSTEEVEREITRVKDLNKANYAKEYDLINKILSLEKNGYDLMNIQTNLKSALLKAENENREITVVLENELNKKAVKKL